MINVQASHGNSTASDINSAGGYHRIDEKNAQTCASLLTGLVDSNLVGKTTRGEPEPTLFTWPRPGGPGLHLYTSLQFVHNCVLASQGLEVRTNR